MRTTTDIINQAISENRKPEWLLYAFATIFVITGEVIVGWAMSSHSPFTASIGVVLNGLAWPAFRETRAIRAENLMLRMLEVPLAQAQTADEAAKMLTERFSRHFNPTKTVR